MGGELAAPLHLLETPPVNIKLLEVANLIIDRNTPSQSLLLKLSKTAQLTPKILILINHPKFLSVAQLFQKFDITT